MKNAFFIIFSFISSGDVTLNWAEELTNVYVFRVSKTENYPHDQKLIMYPLCMYPLFNNNASDSEIQIAFSHLEQSLSPKIIILFPHSFLTPILRTDPFLMKCRQYYYAHSLKVKTIRGTQSMTNLYVAMT